MLGTALPLLLSLALGLPVAPCFAGEALPAAAGARNSAADIAAGKAAFARQCASCHKVGPSARAGFGPHLNHLLGRKAGSTPDYAYSSAMRASGIVWSRDALHAFLRDPDKVVPGTRMRFWGIGSDREIDQLLAYLRTFQ